MRSADRGITGFQEALAPGRAQPSGTCFGKVLEEGSLEVEVSSLDFRIHLVHSIRPAFPQAQGSAPAALRIHRVGGADPHTVISHRSGSWKFEIKVLDMQSLLRAFCRRLSPTVFSQGRRGSCGVVSSSYRGTALSS